jgi:hypothetical protein
MLKLPILIDQRPSGGWQRPNGLVAATLTVATSLLALGGIFSIIAAWHWPLFGDAGIFHYVVFLIEHGQVPYSEIKDINFPGTYLLDAAAMGIYGKGARGERLYDLSLCLVACASMTLSVGPRFWRRLSGLSAGLLFILIHLQDGLAEAGQRDFAMASLVLLAYAILIRGKARSWMHVFVYELIVGFTLTVKPTLLPLAAVPFLLTHNTSGRVPNCSWRHISLSVAALFVAPTGALLWLWRLDSLRSFVAVFTSIGVLHGQLARKSFWFLLVHSMSPVSLIFVIWLAIILTSKMQRIAEHRALVFCVICGFASYYAQGKGLSYQRYPFLAFALLLIFSDFYDAALRSGWSRYLAVLGFALAGMLFAPKLAWSVVHFDTATPFEQALTNTLIESGVAQSKNIQCLDTFSGCLTTLYQLQSIQSTGYLYDCYLFTAPSTIRDQYRTKFLAEIHATQPRAIVLTDELCFAEHQGFDWIDSWPDLASYLSNNYLLNTEWSSRRTYRWWNRPQRPTAFRVYLKK